MKKVLYIIGSICNKKIVKKILGFFILVGVGTMLFAKNDALAQDESGNTVVATDTRMEKMSEINELFTYISRTIYALLWPVLFIAGISLDNTLVYGSFLHLDASLWQLWNIMKNFANFALGFMVLFAIVKNIFTSSFGKSGDKRGPVSIIKKTLIAGILIQASWFLIAAVIDISTILTYSIGGLPMTIMQNNPQQQNLPILGVNAILSTKEDTNKMGLEYYNTYGDIKISQCDVRKVPSLTGDFIVGRKKIKVDNETFFEPGYCTLGGWPYHYNENPDYSEFSGNDVYIAGLNNYFSSGYQSLNTTGILNTCYIIPTSFSELLPSCAGLGYGILDKDDNFFTKAKDDKSIKYTIDNLLDKSKGFVGPFITIYSSLLDFSSLTSSPNGGGVVADFLNLVIKLFFAVILFVPLVTLTLVLIVRIGTLWIVIAASPIMALLAVFKDTLDIKSGSDGFMSHFSGPNIIKLIFAPVFVVFAISMSMIFLSALNPRDTAKGSGLDGSQMATLGMERINEKTYSILGLVEITLDIEKVDQGMDMFAWFITMFFATGIVWFFLFFAIRMTKIGESLGKGIQDSVQKLAANLPIIPMGGGGIGISAASQGLKDVGNKIPNELNRTQMDNLRERYPWLYSGASSDDNRGKDKNQILSDFGEPIKNIVTTGISSGKNMNQIWDELSKEQQNKLTTAGYVGAAGIGSLYNQEIAKEFTKDVANKDIIAAGKGFANNDIVDNADAQKFSVDQINNAIASDDNWKTWAKTVLGSPIHTIGGVMVMDNVGAQDQPVYRVVDRDVYEKKYFGNKKLSEVTQDDLKKANEKGTEKFETYKKSIEEHQKQLEELNKLKESNSLKEDDKLILSQKEELKEYFELLNKQ